MPKLTSHLTSPTSPENTMVIAVTKCVRNDAKQPCFVVQLPSDQPHVPYQVILPSYICSKASIWDDLRDIDADKDKDNTATVFVDFNEGNNNNNGSIQYPLKHLDLALKFLRKKYGTNAHKRIILRAGKHYIRKTIHIIPLDNNLLITNSNGELADLFGATEINCSCGNAAGFENVNNVYSCEINDRTIDDIDELQINGIRARYPNGNLEVYSWISPTCGNSPEKEYNPEESLPSTSSGRAFAQYQVGVGACCNGFTPNAGYCCGNQSGGAFTYLILSGFQRAIGETDSAEFFYDAETNILYYVNNIAPLLIHYTGTMSNQRKNQVSTGATIRDTKLTYNVETMGQITNYHTKHDVFVTYTIG